MKFRTYKDEKELMDAINPENSNHRKLMAEYALSLSKRFGISIEKAIDEAKRLLECKKNGIQIESTFIEESALDYKAPFVPVPRKREKSYKAGLYTEHEILCIINETLIKEISAYYDIPEENKRNFYIKDTVEWFCEFYGTDPLKTVEILKALFRKKRRESNYSYDGYRGNELNRIVGVPADSKYGKYDKMVKSLKREVSFEDDFEQK